ncbi:MAG: metal-dependent transcriptional regulator [Flavobacteriaceae bacterium]|nr:metal-dependent transcriptional regulator [Flavobacteriaceae bacterium]
MLTKTEENYIKEIFTIETITKKDVSTNSIAKKLDTKPSTVTDMLKKLATKKLLSYQKYKGVKLNNKGKTIALSVIRKHRLWETFLVKKLNFSWDEVHEIAEQLEHIKSDKLTNRLDQFLGFPTVDPHGDPIPNANGEFTKTKTICLTKLTINTESIFVEVKNASDKFLKYLSKNNIAIGSKIKILYIEEFDNSVDILVNNKQINVSESVAKNIYLNN